MTFEEAFDNLCKKYGPDFNWSAIAFTNKYYIDEAKKEIGPGHPLYGKVMYSTAKCDSNDDVMFVTCSNHYIILHLTYCKNIDTAYPKHILFESLESAVEYMEKRYLDEYE